MKPRIVLVVFVVVLLSLLVFMAWNQNAHAKEITSLRNRVYNLELVINQGLLDKKEAASRPDTMKKAEPGMSI